MSRFLLCVVVVVAAFSGVVGQVGGPSIPNVGDAGLAVPNAPNAPNVPNALVPAVPNAAPAKPNSRFEGAACSFRGAAGVCQSTPCGGQAVTGLCKGPANVQCCVPKPAVNGPVIPDVGDNRSVIKPAAPTTPGKAVVLMPNGQPAPNGTPNGPFPYTFPYSQARHIVADFNLQRIRLYDGSQMVKEWKLSSGKYGIGFKVSGRRARPG